MDRLKHWQQERVRGFQQLIRKARKEQDFERFEAVAHRLVDEMIQLYAESNDTLEARLERVEEWMAAAEQEREESSP